MTYLGWSEFTTINSCADKLLLHSHSKVDQQLIKNKRKKTFYPGDVANAAEPLIPFSTLTLHKLLQS